VFPTLQQNPLGQLIGARRSRAHPSKTAEAAVR
jgi:hypothetical protein